RGPVGPVFHDRFLLVGQVGAVADYLLYLVGVARTRIEIRHRRRTKLSSRCKREWRYQSPLRSDKALRGDASLAVGNQKWLPAVGICDLRWAVDRLVPGIVGITSRRQIAELL